jgi:hypothetical protein
MPARDYFVWLKESHYSSDWLCFDRALEAHAGYERARIVAHEQRLAFECVDSVFNEADSMSRQSAKTGVFVALSKQIIAREEFARAVRRCEQYCSGTGASSDICRLLYWLQAQSSDAEEAVNQLLGLGSD